MITRQDSDFVVSVFYAEVMILFKVGDKIVYPHHGAGVVEGVSVMKDNGSKKKHYVLRFPPGDLKVTIPADNYEAIGVREIILRDEVDKVIKVLKQGPSTMPVNWNHRYKKNRDKLRSGDVYQVAEVVRNLTLRNKEKGLSAGEKQMLVQARKILVSELVYALETDREEVELTIDKILDKNGKAKRGNNGTKTADSVIGRAGSKKNMN